MVVNMCGIFEMNFLLTEILDWLTNPDNMEMTDSIERANRKMFEKMRKSSEYLAVFFCKLINFL